MNNLKTFFLFALLTSILVAIGWAIGGYSGMIVFLVLAAVLNFSSYWFSDKLALKASGAKEVTAEEEPRLHAIVDEVAHLAMIPKPRVYVINQDTPNAFATGRNASHAAVAVTSGIMRILDERELRGVLGHELGHIRNHDILISTVVATVAGAITMIAWMLQWSMIFGGGRRSGRDNPLGIVALLATVILAPIAASLIRMAISRGREFQADSTGARMVHDPEALASALLKLNQGVQMRPMAANGLTQATAHLYIVNPFKGEGMTNLFSTHPPIEERVRRLYAMAGLAYS
jgi:heat shock protein HtpX